MAYYLQAILTASTAWTLRLVCSVFLGTALAPYAAAQSDTAPTAGAPKAGDAPAAATAKPEAAKPAAPKSDPAKPAASKTEKSRSWKPNSAPKVYDGSAPDPSEPPPPPSGGDERNPGGVEHAPNSRQ